MNETAPFNNNFRRSMPPSKSVACNSSKLNTSWNPPPPLSKYMYMAAIYQYFNMRSDIFRNFLRQNSIEIYSKTYQIAPFKKNEPP